MILETGSRIKSSRLDVAGFSLLEILITLGIIALFAGFFTLRFEDSVVEEEIGSAVSELRTMALKAKRRSYAFKRDQYIVFSGDSIFLTETLHRLQEPGFSIETDESILASFVPAPSLIIEFQSIETKEWELVPEFTWRFRGSGISDPVKVRFSRDRAHSLLEFNVLTALAEEEEFFP